MLNIMDSNDPATLSETICSKTKEKLNLLRSLNRNHKDLENTPCLHWTIYNNCDWRSLAGSMYQCSFDLNMTILAESCQVSDAESIRRLFSLVDQDELFEMLNDKVVDLDNEDTFIHHLVRINDRLCIKALTDGLRKLSKAYQLTLLFKTNRFGQTLLHAACTNTKRTSLIASILNLLPSQEHRIRLIEFKDITGKSAMFYAAALSDSYAMKLLLLQYQKYPERLLEHLKLRDIKGQYIFHLVCRRFHPDPAMLKLLIQKMEELGPKDFIEALITMDNDGETVLHKLWNTRKLKNTKTGDVSALVDATMEMMTSILDIIQKLSPSDFLHLLTARSALKGRDKIMLHNVVEWTVEAVKCVLNLVPADIRDEMLLSQDADGWSCFHFASATCSRICAYLIRSIDNAKVKFAICEQKTNDGMNVLFTAILSGKVDYLLKMLGTQTSDDLLRNSRNKRNQSPLIFSLSFQTTWVDLLNYCINNFPRHSLFSMLTVRDGVNWSIIHHICAYGGTRLANWLEPILKVMKIILCGNLIKFVQHEDDNGNTAIHLAALTLNFAALTRILDIVTDKGSDKSKLRQLLGKKNKIGCTPKDLAQYGTQRMVKEQCIGYQPVSDLPDVDNLEAKIITLLIIDNYPNNVDEDSINLRITVT